MVNDQDEIVTVHHAVGIKIARTGGTRSPVVNDVEQIVDVDTFVAVRVARPPHYWIENKGDAISGRLGVRWNW